MKFPISDTDQEALKEQNVRIIKISSDNISEYRTATSVYVTRLSESNPPTDPIPYIYRVGTGDQLHIQSWSSPERKTQESDLENDQGPIVNESGEIFYPFVGALIAKGRTVDEIRVELTKKLRVFISDPQVEVSVAEFNAHSATISGAIGDPGKIKLTNLPVRLLEVVNSAQTVEDSDLRQITINRGSRKYIVNLKSYMQNASRRQNPIILPGDVIFVPTLADNKIFTFGEIGTGEIALGEGRKTLAEVLAEVGGLDKLRSDARGVFVFRRTRSAEKGFDVIQFNLREATTLVLAAEFEMAPVDILFVTNDPITRWNDTVGKLLSPMAGFAQARLLAQSLAE